MIDKIYKTYSLIDVISVKEKNKADKSVRKSQREKVILKGWSG